MKSVFLCLSLSFLFVPFYIHLSKATSEGQVKSKIWNLELVFQ